MTIANTLRLSEVRQMALSGRAREIRETARLSASEIARTVGVSVPTVIRWERGARAPTGDAALRYGALLRALETDLESPAQAASTSATKPSLGGPE